MARFRPYPIAAFAAVTLLIWGNRVWLNWTAPHVGVAAKVALSVPITCFVVASLVLLAAMLRGADPRHPRFRALVRAFAAGTVVFWAVRLPMILVHQHPAAFKVVHAALAVASVMAAVLAWRAVPAASSPSGQTGDASRVPHPVAPRER
ncbi:MAG: hypothetical protein JWN46_2130 [Acidimicrobiales bacterium]|nr:hypothetical protein [Acidimicrobiales bacterium]